MYFYGLNLEPLQQGHLGPCSLDLNKLGKRPLGNATLSNFKQLSQMVLKKIFEYYFMYFYGSNIGPSGRGHLEPLDLWLNTFG